MALGFVQGTFVERNSAGTVNTQAFTSNVTAGDIIVAFVWIGTGASVVTFTNSGTAGITWNAASYTSASVQGGTGFVFRHDAMVNTSGSCTVIATANNSTPNALLLIGEFNIGGNSLVRDTNDNIENTQSATTSFVSATLTTVNNPDILICWYDNNGSTTAFTGGITSGWAENVWDSGYQSGFASAVVTTPTTYTLAATQTSGGDDSVIFAYQATAASVTPVNATVSATGKSVFSHGGRLINNATVSI